MSREKSGGRKAGTPNKLTSSIKAALMTVYDRRGGDDALLEWSNEHPSEFYALMGRLIPKEPAVAVGPVSVVQWRPDDEHVYIGGPNGYVVLPKKVHQDPID